ncbi:major facilitator superfamily domain-containing protein [Kickxella alabastrina]|uniref:major facilitator superfamily domain-containing protein n=1 Tax=Kickxella alabastrina TaxID=61397 RepID=UPI0022210F31|nr:major facilitator superfamily domain-containing protein [Kickxella alabastrina]KAI7832107.1 major facilitator superfamily domain-containing protein [Kickxella alabastrina]KAJ1946768.1 hypothetical protein GGF37_000949 [Kickxella alabastrina]
MFLDSKLNSIPAIKKIRRSPTTIWVVSSLFLCIDTFIYALPMANLPEILQTRMHVSTSSNGTVTAMFGVGAAVSALIAGFVSDRFHTRRTLQILASVFYIVSGTVFYFVGNYYQLLLFRLIDGLAAGVSCTMLYTTVGDVYSAGLLGFKVAIIYFCNNIGYTIGPICGQKLFEIGGIPGTAAMVIALGLLELLLLLTIVDDSLKIKQYVVSREARLPESILNNYTALSPLDSGVDAGRTDKDDTAKQLLSESESPKVNINPNQDSKPDTPLWKFMLRLPVVASTLSIIASIGIQCTLDTLIPLHLIDKFQRSDSGGITFVIYGLALTVFVPVVGKLNNWLIKRSRPATIWATSSVIGLVNRLIYTLTIACIPDILQESMNLPRANNGIITTAFGVGGLIAGSTIGYISDHTQNRRTPQLVAALLYVVAGLIFFFTDRFYQIVIFRVVLGAASSIADTMLFTTVADVYPANLLGFKMSVIFVFDNIGNMVGPIIGGKVYETMGVRGIGIITLVLGVAEVLMILIFVRNSLDIRQSVTMFSTETEVSNLSEIQTAQSTIVPTQSSIGSMVEINSVINKSNNIEATPRYSMHEGTLTRSQQGASMQLWRLLLTLPVLGPTVSIFVAAGMQSVIETIFPLRLFDKFGYSPGIIGMAFLIVGGILILTMPLVGWLSDFLVSRYGERARYYNISVGVLLMLLSLIAMAVAKNYTMHVFGYAMFGIMSMVVMVPAQSAFGDFINASESQAMAQCYSLAWIAEGLANISLPPIASALYAAIGFSPMLISMGSVLCTVCVLVVLALPLRIFWRRRIIQY